MLEKLLTWASACLEKSLNQPALPHAIIAANFTDLSINATFWEIEAATDKLMSDFNTVGQTMDKFQELASYWRGRRRPISNVKDLLLCYYSSISVVKIPVKGRYGKMMEQVGKLRGQIMLKCRDAHTSKKASRMMPNSEDLQKYLVAAFEHFSRDLDKPFNFMDVSLKINPIPRDFSGNMLQLAIALKNHPEIHLDGDQMFEELAHIYASCIRLDIARQRLLGS